jgi:hypothetical protein
VERIVAVVDSEPPREKAAERKALLVERDRIDRRIAELRQS